MRDDNQLVISRFNESQHRLISAVLLGLMMASAGLTFAQVGHIIMPTWNGVYLVVIGFLIALERFYTMRAVKKMTVMGREWVVAVSTQWVINLIVIKLMVSLSAGLGALLAEIPLWQRSFAQVFFSSEFLVAVGFAILVWMFSGIMVAQLDEMGLDTALIERDAMTSVVRDQAPPRQRLMATLFGIGAVLMFFTAMARLDVRAFFMAESVSFRHNLSPLDAGGAGTLLYFLFALCLLSQGNYITLNTRWFLQRLPVSRNMASRWAIYSITFLLLIVVIASVLPTSYSLGLLSVLGYLIDIVISILMTIIGFFYLLISLLISLPFLLFQREPPVELPQAPPPEILATPPPNLAEPGVPVPWLDLLKSVIFWAIFLVVVGYSINQYLRQHQEILAALRKFPGWKLIAGIWNWFRSLFVNLQRGVGKAIEAGRSRLRSSGDPVKFSGLNRILGLRRLSPRQKVYFYYHALLRRGNETGLPRDLSQTPDEYAQVVERSLPTVEGEVEALTESFSEARYSRHAIAEQDASIVKTYWEQIRRVFRGRRG